MIQTKKSVVWIENKCEISRCTDRKTHCDSALSGVSHHNGYRGKICDIWHRKGDEILFFDWLQEVKKERSLIKGREKGIKITPPYIITHTCIVELIFKMCKDLNQPADTRYRTVELFDRFISSHFIDILKVIGKKQDQVLEWNNAMPRVCGQVLLRVVSCIQLASKFCAHSSIVSPKTAHVYLSKRGQTYTIQNILSSEIKVFKTLNYNIGVPTLLVFTDVLLPLLRDIIHDKIYTVCINIVDIVYLNRQEIFKKLGDKILSRWHHIHSKKYSYTSYEFDGLYCGAACISAALKIFYPNDNSTIDTVNNKLSTFIERPINEILTFSSVILQTIGM